MACKAFRRKRWVVDYVDASGRRRIETCPNEEYAEQRVVALARQALRRCHPGIRLDTSLGEYAAEWLDARAAAVRLLTLETYRAGLRYVQEQPIGAIQLSHLGRAHLKEWVLWLANRSGLARSTARRIVHLLCMVLDGAVDDEAIESNPAAKIQKLLGRARRGIRPDEALTADQLGRLLTAAKVRGDHYEELSLFAWTGLRTGEGLGLQWGDVDLDARQLAVRRQVYPGRTIEPLKSEAGYRTVDLGPAIVGILRARRARQREAALAAAAPSPTWVLFPEWGETPGAHGGRVELQRAMRRLCAAAGLPGFTIRSLRHSFATLLLEQGEMESYVQQQLGHESIQVTVDVYGRCRRSTSPGAMQRLAEQVEDRKQIALFRK